MKHYETVDAVIRVWREHEETIMFETVFKFDGKTKRVGPDIDGLALTPCQAVVRAASKVVLAAGDRADILTVYTADKQALAFMTGLVEPRTPEMRALVGRLREAVARARARVVYADSGNAGSSDPRAAVM